MHALWRSATECDDMFDVLFAKRHFSEEQKNALSLNRSVADFCKIIVQTLRDDKKVPPRTFIRTAELLDAYVSSVEKCFPKHLLQVKATCLETRTLCCEYGAVLSRKDMMSRKAVALR